METIKIEEIVSDSELHILQFKINNLLQKRNVISYAMINLSLEQAVVNECNDEPDLGKRLPEKKISGETVKYIEDKKELAFFPDRQLTMHIGDRYYLIEGKFLMFQKKATQNTLNSMLNPIYVFEHKQTEEEWLSHAYLMQNK